MARRRSACAGMALARRKTAKTATRGKQNHSGAAASSVRATLKHDVCYGGCARYLCVLGAAVGGRSPRAWAGRRMQATTGAAGKGRQAADMARVPREHRQRRRCRGWCSRGLCYLCRRTKTVLLSSYFSPSAALCTRRSGVSCEW